MQWLWVTLAVVQALIFGRSMLLAGFFAYLIGWPVMLLMLVFGPKKGTWERRTAALEAFKEEFEKSNRPEGYEDFETVDDLMKQLEKK
jgi:hypothetical protein